MKTFIERLKLCFSVLTGTFEDDSIKLRIRIATLEHSLEFYKQEVFELESYIDNVLNKAPPIEDEHNPTEYLVEAFAKHPKEG